MNFDDEMRAEDDRVARGTGRGPARSSEAYDAPEVVLCDLDRGPPDDRARERLRVSLRSYKGHPFVDVRLVFRGRDGEYRGTQKGVTVKRRELEAVLAALGEAMGWVG
jgi:hypothetical protein